MLVVFLNGSVTTATCDKGFSEFNEDAWRTHDDGTLTIERAGGEMVAEFAPGKWMYVRRTGAEFDLKR